MPRGANSTSRAKSGTLWPVADLYVTERRRLETQHPSSDFDRFVATTRLLKSET
jgi:hypothetical protein